ncbi:MAG: lysophospholipid acyltransferase family protein [Nostoc sp. DedQUE04]|uniref:lysophospholipid acyltransferase family protein n=1 Tax=Nostoc sp. DedQUE04 TaxID=3075390 RepID=UPI002AD42CDB|nr:lysophospholipid acyltransferase family protein [Nostoc sp. DedQUE04]MDZ8135447.1 lysophospholipid acyltransferase family protein [Nostoc sp. DedQUE04]
MTENQLLNWLVNIGQNIIWISGKLLYQHWFQLKCQGLENIPQDRAYIIAANHVSHLDGPAVIAAQGKHFKNVYSLAAKDYFFNRPFKAWVCQNFFNMICFERKGNFLNSLRFCQKIVEQNKVILFFPEGTRSITGELQRLKLGLGLLVLHLNVPVIPVYIHGTYQALPKGRHFPKRHPIYVSFGLPLDFRHYQTKQNILDTRQIQQQIINDVYVAIAQLHDNLRGGVNYGNLGT